MKGLEEARRYYEDFGRDMLHARFPEFEERIAVGLVGRGSECFGFDDDISRDHDFEQGFCLWLTDADDLLCILFFLFRQPLQHDLRRLLRDLRGGLRHNGQCR